MKAIHDAMYHQPLEEMNSDDEDNNNKKGDDITNLNLFVFQQKKNPRMRKVVNQLRKRERGGSAKQLLLKQSPSQDHTTISSTPTCWMRIVPMF